MDPTFTYWRSMPGGPIPLDPETAATLIPVSRPGLDEAYGSGITYDQYLGSIRRMILDRRRTIEQALEEMSGVRDTRLTAVRIITEKHGSDYHPARIVAVTADGEYSFALNSAVTDRGFSRIKGEYSVLDHLWTTFPRKFVPHVRFLTESTHDSAAGHCAVRSAFLADWLDGFSEFHLAEERAGGPLSMIVWDMKEGYRFLSEADQTEIYKQAAFILTYYFDTKDFRAIFPWHHAAGDFVVSTAGGAPQVRLIAARQYEPIFEGSGAPDATRALLFFLAGLTLRMRLDRLDGVGSVAWAGDHAVDAVIAGFLEALNQALGEGRVDPALPPRVGLAAGLMSPELWADIFLRTTTSYDASSADAAVIEKYLADHIVRVYRCFQELRR